MMKTAFLYTIVKRWAFIVGVAAMLLVNYLSTALPIGGMTNADVSAKYPTLITPAGYAFAIWGVIYLGLIVFAWFQLRRGRENRFYKMIWPYFMVNAGANIVWLIAFQHELLGLSVLVMGVLLGSLIGMFRLFYRLKRTLSTTHRFFFHVPFGIYFAWVSIASIVNVAVWLSSMEVPYFAEKPELWALAVLIVGFCLAMWLLISQSDYIYALTVVWAYAAIMVNHYDIEMVRYPAKVGALLLLITTVGLFISDRLKVAQFGRKRSQA